MATDKEFQISDISYTNKDFQTIFPELLDLVKKVTSKWDPTITNESDPGVVLLKVMALIADKNNYNIDKNVLECFPLSVTQDKNAYQLFEQLGYRMKWYRAAGSKSRWVEDEEGGHTRYDDYPIISLKWIGDDIDGDPQYTIPQFTMVCDEESNIIYTIVANSSIVASKKVLNSVGGTEENVIQVPALQGVAVEYTINNETRIRYSNLDSHNRLYFGDFNVAENGIFIAQYDSSDYTSWKRVDNIESRGVKENDTLKKYYKFGLSQELDKCYIEFPENASDLIGEGIKIVYIKTDGEDGNVPSRTITQGYQVPNLKSSSIGNFDDVVFNDNISVTNTSEIENGQNPESIDDAYRNYTRTIGTFDTLVTLRDYLNAILNSGEVSNGFVTDRTNDPQSTYKIVTRINDNDTSVVYVENDGTSELMSAFDLKFYLLQNIDNITNKTMFDASFEMLHSEASIQPIEQYIEEQKCIQHDYKYINNYLGKICFFKNIYPIKCKIIPQYNVTSLQAEQIRENVTKAILKGFNAKKVEFGKEVSYEKLYDTILRSDDRIKSIFLDELDYTTYAYTLVNDGGSSNRWEETKVSMSQEDFDRYLENSSDMDLNSIQQEIYAKSVLAGVTQLFEKDTNFTYSIDQNGEISSNIASIETVADGNCDISNGVASYEIKANETVQVYAPTYLQDTVYSSYVRYYFYSENDTTIGTNEQYKLTGTQYIWFAWKENDGDVLYKTKKYEADTIIKPSFSLVSHNSQVVNPTTNDIDGWESLSSTKSCSIMKIAEETCKSTYDCYWITNDVTRDPTTQEIISYDLIFDDNGDKLLMENEYFVYTNTNRTELFIFGSGTKLTYGNTSATLSCKYEPNIAENIQQQGVVALESLWKTGNEIKITDMEIVSAGEGSLIEFAIPSYNSSVEYSQYDVVYSSSTYYVSKQNSNTNNPSDPTYWASQATIDSWVSNASTSQYTIVFYNGGCYVNTTGTNTTTPPSEDTTNWAISIRLSATPTIIYDQIRVGTETLPPREDGRSIILLLSIDTTGDLTQKLESGQSIIATNNVGQQTTIVGEIMIATSLPLSILGGENTKVSYVDNNGDEKFISIYEYNEQQLPTSSTKDTNGKIEIPLPIVGEVGAFVYDDDTTYSMYDMAFYDGNFISSCIDNNTNTISNLKWVAHDAGIDWSSSINFSKYDVAFYNNHWFVSKLDNNVGNQPVEGTYWKDIGATSGTYTWSNSTTYGEFAYVEYNMGVKYVSTIDSNTNNEPQKVWLEQKFMYEWRNNGFYMSNTIVSYNNSYYINTTGTNTTTPPNEDTTNWVRATTRTSFTIDNVSLPIGNYVLPISQQNSDVTSLVCKVGGTPLNQMKSSDTNIKGDLYYSLQVVSQSPTTISIDIQRYASTIEESIFVDVLYKYRTNSIANWSNQAIIGEVQRLDVNNYYNYTYVVSDDIKIENPWLPISFFDANHIYNKFTIAKAGDIALTISNISRR